MNTDDTVTIYDVAREAGVSMATVSRVVNGNKNVKENTRKKSWKSLTALTIDQMQLLVDLQVKKTTTVGVVIPNIDKQLFCNALRKELMTSQRCISIILFWQIVMRDDDKEVSVVNTLF